MTQPSFDRRQEQGGPDRRGSPSPKPRTVVRGLLTGRATAARRNQKSEERWAEGSRKADRRGAPCRYAANRPQEILPDRRAGERGIAPACRNRAPCLCLCLCCLCLSLVLYALCIVFRLGQVCNGRFRRAPDVELLSIEVGEGPLVERGIVVAGGPDNGPGQDAERPSVEGWCWNDVGETLSAPAPARGLLPCGRADDMIVTSRYKVSRAKEEATRRHR